jgi:hypothetical protein
LERLGSERAGALGIDLAKFVYRPLGEFQNAAYKSFKDTLDIPVAEIPLLRRSE